MTANEWRESARSAEQVLYLDYDGVLHPDAVYLVRGYGVHLSLREAPGRQLFDAAPHLIDALGPYPEARIVLSTDWVRRLGFDKAKAALPSALSSRVIGATYHTRQRLRDPLASTESTRGQEVAEDAERRRPRSWVAIDDRDEGWHDAHRHRLVLCNPKRGLEDPAARDCLKATLAREFLM